MKTITKILIITSMLCLPIMVKAGAITNPVITLNPTSIVLDQSNTWTFDFAASSLTGSENLVIYFWQPTSHAAVSLTNLGEKMWSLTITPTIFFGLTQAEIAADPDQFWFNIQDGAGGVTGSLHTTFATPVATTAPVSILSNPLGSYPLDESVTWTFDLTGSGFKAGQNLYMYAWSPTNPDPTYSNSTVISLLIYVSGMTWSKTLTPTTYFGQTVEQIQASSGFWMKLKDQAGKIETSAFNVPRTIKGSSTITVSGTSSLTYSGSPQGPETVDVTGSAGAVSLAYSGTDVTTYGPSATKPTNAGTYQVVADVAADASYNAATSSALAFTIAKATQSITFNALSAKTDIDADFNLNASVTSPLSVSYVSSNQAVATISGNTVTIINEGTTTITATQAGDSNYEAASSVEQILTISTPADFSLRKTVLIDFGGTYATTSAPDVNGNYWNNINTSNANDNFAIIDKTNTSICNIQLLSTFGISGGAANGLATPEAGQLNELAIASATGDYFYTGTSASFKLTGLSPTKRYKFYIFGSRVDASTRQTKFSLTGKNTTAIEGILTTSGTGIGLVSGASYNGNTSSLIITEKLKASDAGEIVINIQKISGANAHMNVMKVEEYQQFSTWSGTGNWSDVANWSSRPGSTAEITVSAGELTLDQSATISKITLAPGTKLTLGNGNTLTANNGIILQSDVNGTATMLNSGTYSGTVTAEQYLGSARNWYVSSPVSSAISPATNVDYYYEYVEAGNNNPTGQPGIPGNYWKGLSNGTSMEVGKGYIAKSNAGTTISFTGTPNNGNITTTFDLTRNVDKGKGFNLAGNPYPSYIDWTDVAAANPNLENTYYYRTKNTINGYTFVTWNGQGNTYVTSNGTANTTITRFIPPTQAFWVRVKSGTSATKMNFTNAMREHRDDNGNLMKAPKRDIRTTLRLQLQNGSESDELLIYQDAEASNGYDAYDSPKMMNNSSIVPDLYTLAGKEKLVINGLSEISENMELPLCFNLNAPATLRIKATEIINLPVNTSVFLLDKLADKQTELTSETEYSFTTVESTTTNESRFSLLFRAPGITTGLDYPGKPSVFINTNNQLIINAPENTKYSIYNAMGQKLNEGKITSYNHASNFTLQAGMYIVKVSDNNKEFTTKILIN